MIRRLVDYVARAWTDQQRFQHEYLLSAEARGLDRQTIVLLLTAAVALTFQHYGIPFRRWLLRVWADAGANAELWRQGGWALEQIFGYVILPWSAHLLLLRKPIREWGSKWRGVGSTWWVYLLMYLLVVPCVLLVSGTDRFQQTYPFYRLSDGESLWPRFLAWELAYAAQFVALEFFFRGYLLHGLKHRFGAYAIFVVTVPYCMIHFGKPLPETLAAIIAGVVLGFMSLATGSIWFGAAVHIAVAWTMDAAALWQRFS